MRAAKSLGEGMLVLLQEHVPDLYDMLLDNASKRAEFFHGMHVNIFYDNRNEKKIHLADPVFNFFHLEKLHARLLCVETLRNSMNANYGMRRSMDYVTYPFPEIDRVTWQLQQTFNPPPI
jgi:hypothetical protein